MRHLFLGALRSTLAKRPNTYAIAYLRRTENQANPTVMTFAEQQHATRRPAEISRPVPNLRFGPTIPAPCA